MMPIVTDAHGAMLSQRYRAMDAKLVEKGFPMTSPWWLETLDRFFASGSRQLVCRVGRRGGKSSTLCRLAVLLALYVEHTIPKGDVGIGAFISSRSDEARARLFTIARILDALGWNYSPRGEALDLEPDEQEAEPAPIRFQVFPCTVAAVSGFTSIFVVADEVAKWRNDAGANPATEVLASLRPTMATQPNARMVLSSSPFGVLDAHAKAFELGDTQHQVTAFAPTWIANPTITEDETHALEPDERLWKREYAAIPSATETCAFELEEIDRCFRAQPESGNLIKHRAVLIVDPSSGKGDAFTWLVARWVQRTKPGTVYWWRKLDRSTPGLPLRRCSKPEEPDWARDFDGNKLWVREPFEPGELEDWSAVIVEEVDGVDRKFSAENAHEVFDAATRSAARWGAYLGFGDQRDELACVSEFSRRGIRYTSHTWTNENKRIAVELVRRWMATDRLILPEHAKLRDQLKQFETKITPGGYETYAGRGKHDDYAALLLTLAMTEIVGKLPQSGMRVATARGNVKFWPSP